MDMLRKMLIHLSLTFIFILLLTTCAWSSSVTDPLLHDSESIPEQKSLQMETTNGAVQGTIASSSSRLTYQGEQAHVVVDFGFGYYNPDWSDSSIQARIGAGWLFGENLALGSLFSINQDTRDLVVNTAWQSPLDGLLLKASLGYLWGEKDFDFTTGTSSKDLGQFSWVLGGEWVLPQQDSDLGLHSFGLSVWGARASDESDDTPVTYVTQDATAYYVNTDPLKLSEGKMLGISLDAQYALTKNIVTNGSVGYEQVEFPYANGSIDEEKSLYSDLSISWEIIDNFILETGWKNGSSEDRYRASLSTGALNLDGWYSSGRNDLDDEQAVMLTYTFLLGKTNSKNSLASRSRPSYTPNMLQDVVKRPEQMPVSFLAKADLTAITQDATIDKTALDSGVASVDSSGNVHITVGSGTPAITGVTRNGNAFTYAGIIEVSSGDIVIHPSLLPEGTATYHISVNAGGAYTIELETE